ncbi:MAG: hypothetical protein R3C46_04720 [Hyphomonadaceae bacterium]
MNVTREEAAKALDDINRASDRVVQLKGYHHGAPHFIIWGLVWLGANSATYFIPGSDKYAWPAALAFGFVASMIAGILQSRKWPRGRHASAAERRFGYRMGMTAAVVMAFIVCITLIAQPSTSREINAMISIIFPFLYIAGGIWAGWRLLAIGLVTAAAIMIGFYWLPDHFDLWMGLFGGGSLIAGGIWLRTA